MVVIESRLVFSSAGQGFLAQSDPATDVKSFNHLTSDFGVIKPSWQQFDKDFKALQASADRNTRYKLLYLARHGQGMHNYYEQLIGLEAWNVSADLK
jgi:hypothetical protein